jgi:pimeloyl-ACP methyl ester carboxylesterase
MLKLRLLGRSCLLLLAGSLTSGCLSVSKYQDIQRSLPAKNLLLVDGRYVHVEQHGFGRPLVLLHGFGGSTYSWRKVVPELAGEFRTIAIDLHGFGWTERPKEADAYKRTGQVRLVKGVLDHLGIDSAVLVGHSYGAAVALSVATAHPERVHALVLLDAVAPSWMDLRKSRVTESRTLARLLLPFALSREYIAHSLRGAYFDDSMVNEELVEIYRERMKVEGVLDAFVHLSTPPATPNPPIDLTAIRQPTLFVWGEDDHTIPVDVARPIALTVPGARFVTLPDCGHVPMEERPESVVQELRRFLAELEAPASNETIAGGSRSDRGLPPAGQERNSPSPPRP